MSFSPARSSLPPLPHVRPPRPPFSRLTRWQLFLLVCLGLVLLSGTLGVWSLLPRAAATSAASDPPASLLYHDFLTRGRLDHPQTTFRFPTHGPHVPGLSPNASKPFDRAHLPRLSGPVTMAPLTQTLDPTLFTTDATTGGSPLDLLGSDHHLELLLLPQSLDLSQATIAGGGPPQLPLSLHLTQQKGSYRDLLTVLAVYQLQILDGGGQVVSGLRLTHPFTLRYHYQAAELTALHLDIKKMFLSYPELLSAARTAHASTDGLMVPLGHDASTQTLSTQSRVLPASSLTLSGSTLSADSGSGTSSGAPSPLVASEQGNSGQLGLSYPLAVAPGTAGFAPQLALQYSSQETNGRTDPSEAAPPAGDGWSLPIASIGHTTSTMLPANFLTDFKNRSEWLVSNDQTGLEDTEHLSHLRILSVTSSQTHADCFQVYDRAGTFYEFGCTPDSYQYTITHMLNSPNTTTVPKEWDLDRVVAPHEGSGSPAAYIAYHYLQVCNDGPSCPGSDGINSAIIT